MKGQQYIRFPPQVNAFLTGNPAEAEDAVLPLFRELSAEDEVAFRTHARENYHVGDPIDNLFHPIWRDEANLMNEETSKKEDNQG